MPIKGLQSMLFYDGATIHYTENPQAEVWSFFLRLADIGYLKGRWKNRPENEYCEVSTLITQAHEYFLAAKSVSLRTRPLLVYYSFLNLTKAVLFIAKDDEPPNFHGLAKDISGASLLDFSMLVKEGIFYGLAQQQGFNVALGSRLTMRDFLGNAIELAESMEDYFGEPRKIYRAQVEVFLGGPIQLRMSNKLLVTSGGNPSQHWAALLNDFEIKSTDADWIYLIAKPGATVERVRDRRATELLTKHFVFSVFYDRIYYFNANEQSVRMPQACAYYGVMLILAAIVRYKPKEIHSYMDAKDTSLRWFLQKVCDTAERTFPNLLMNLLLNKTNKFVSSTAF